MGRVDRIFENPSRGRIVRVEQATPFQPDCSAGRTARFRIEGADAGKGKDAISELARRRVALA